VEAQFEELLREKGVATVVIEDICAMENIETKWLYVFMYVTYCTPLVDW
jgi:hypothetical protein